ncbi:hypothetical protein [Paracoccus sp. ME4]|uniref:hypothetical protein n=1 Tax=Paracoccus sp. ME4 TaxID=3138066 RepID=UPI00398AE697
MTDKSRYYLLANDLSGDDAEEVRRELMTEFLRAGMTVDAYLGIGRMVLVIPETYASDAVEQCLKDMEYKIAAQWLSGPRSGKLLTVNLTYRQDLDLVSASVDEALLVSALAGLEGQDQAMEMAITALAQDNEFTPGYSPMDGSIFVEDVMVAVEHWNRNDAVKWSPFGWDPDEPMLEITFTPEADMESQSSIIPVHVEGMPLEWKMPLRLLPEGVDPDDRDALDQLASLPCAPEKVRLWASMMPFTVVIENPEIITEPNDGPGF